MAAVPVTIVGMIYPRNKTVEPYPATIAGFANITGLGVGGGPILPPDTPIDPPIEPPLEIWPGPGDPDFPGGGVGAHPEHPIVLPDPIQPPEQPPATPVGPHEGWNWKPSTPNSPAAGWYYLYVPRNQGAAEPKRR